MAANDIKVLSSGGASQLPVLRWKTSKLETTINPGEPVMFNSGIANTNDYVIALTDGKPLVGTDYFVGIAASTSTHTSSADGYVDVYQPISGAVYRAKAKSTTAADTQSEVDDLVGKHTLFDLTASTYTIDTAASDDINNGLLIVGGNPSNNEVDFQINPRATYLSR